MKPFGLFILSFISHQSAFSQNTIKTTGACPDIIAQKADGRWIKSADVNTINSKDCNNRLDAIHELVLKTYPEPKGVHAAWAPLC